MNIYQYEEDLYSRFVGSITPEEFVQPFDGDIEEAVSSLLEEEVFDWDGSSDSVPPVDLFESLVSYCKREMTEHKTHELDRLRRRQEALYKQWVDQDTETASLREFVRLFSQINSDITEAVFQFVGVLPEVYEREALPDIDDLRESLIEFLKFRLESQTNGMEGRNV